MFIDQKIQYCNDVMISRFSTIPIKTLECFFGRHLKADSKIHMQRQRIWNSQGNFEKEEQSWSP